jgi:N-glycosylase/DNA lyase
MPFLPLTYPLDLSATLLGGQSFCWQQVSPDLFQGWIQSEPVRVEYKAGNLSWDNPSLSADQIRRYLSLDLDLPSIFKAFPPSDLHLKAAWQSHSGLRPVQEDPWECLSNFICSSLKQIIQIRQINDRLRTSLGGTHRVFPSPKIICQAGEAALRACSLGYRARHLAATAKILAENPAILDIPPSLSTQEAAARLETLPGVGPKISRCVLLYAYSRWDAFPVDVWVSRLVWKLYFPRKRKSPRLSELEHWSAKHFGPHSGLAQLFLFHWFRTGPGARTKASPKETVFKRRSHRGN